MSGLRVIELINKLEQFPPDYYVRFEDINNYGGIVEDVDFYPNETCGCIQLKSYHLVREELQKQLKTTIQETNIDKLRRSILHLTTKGNKNE